MSWIYPKDGDIFRKPCVRSCGFVSAYFSGMSGCDIEATWSLWSGTGQEDGLFSVEDSRQGCKAKHVLVCFDAD